MNSPSPRLHRAVILAAGRSTRLDSLKLHTPKPLINVAGQPLLAHHLERCAALGIDEIYMNLHYLPEQICNFVGDGSRWKIKVIYNQEIALAGTAGGVKNFSAYLRDEPFIVLYGDNYCTFSLDELIQAHFNRSPRPDMSIVLFDLENVGGSGVAICGQNDLIESFIEKPAPGETESHWVNAGVYLMEPHLLEAIPEGVCDFGREVIPAFLASGKRVLGVKTQGRVYAVDTPELLERTVTIRSPI